MNTGSWPRKARAWSRTLLGRSVLFSLFLLALTGMIAGLVISNSQKTLYEEIVARNTSHVASTAEQLALSLENTTDLQKQMLYEQDINRLGIAPDYYSGPQAIFAMLRVQERMLTLTNSSPLVERSLFLAPAIGKIISESGVEKLDSDSYGKFNRLCVEQNQAFIETEGQFYIMSAYPPYLSYLKENGAEFILCLQLNQKALLAFLEAHRTQTDAAMVLLNDNGRLICKVSQDRLICSETDLYEKVKTGTAFDIFTTDGIRCLASAARDEVSGKGFFLVQLQPYGRVFSVLNRQGLLFLALILLLVIAHFAYGLHMWRRIHRPLNKLSEAFQQMEGGDFSLRIHHDRNDDFSGIYDRFNKMNSRLGDLISQVYEQTIRTQKAELKQLQSQINPHFLYNNLFIIRSLAQLGDTDTIETVAADLGEYFRYVTRVGNQEVTLAAEVAHARNYAMLQDMRFSSRIALDFPPLPGNMENAPVPRLILQPLLENAYQHGLKETAANGKLRISFAAEGEDILITVEDNGTALADETLEHMIRSLDDPNVQETTGFINIHRRLQLRFGAPYGLACSRGEWGGLKVTMRIPSEGRTQDAKDSDR
ncbi:MAG: histidine kinase [Clostridia bacterium]|nr:histidine kinase [Clostridia bacterium]